MPLNQIPSKDVAIKALELILNDQESSYDLVTFETFRNGKKLRSDRYNHFNVLCYKNTLKAAGWSVCKYALHGGCKLSSALLVYNTATGGTGRLERHISQHVGKQNTLQHTRKLPQMSKKLVARSATLAVAFDLRPISFTDNKRGLSYFVNSIFKAGQSTPANDNVDPCSLLPCAKSISLALTQLANDNREEYRTLLISKLCETGGGVTTDGLTMKVQDKQFYDLTLHFIDVKVAPPFSHAPKISMCAKTLLLQEKKGDGSGEKIRALLNGGLKTQYGCDMDTLTKTFTMVTDNAAVMARVARASVSTRLAPMNESWMGCLVHQINTAMKCCVDSLANNEELHKIFDDIKSVKIIVRIFKQGGWNSILPSGLNLIQEVETRFGTTFLVVERFLKAASVVKEIIAAKDSSPAKDAFAKLSKSVSLAGIVSYPALEAVIDAFQDVIELQIKLEASNKPTLHIALPLLQRCYDKLESIADGGSVWRGENIGFVPSTRLSRKMCRSILEWIEAKVRIHPLLMAGSYLNPLFREFQYLNDVNKREAYRDGAEAIIRSMIAGPDNANAIAAALEGDDIIPPQRELVSEQGVVNRRRTFSLLEYTDSHFQSTTPGDELTRYSNMDIGQLPIDREKYVKDDFAAVRFWHMHRATYPTLFKIALRLYAIPVSSCASERVFSAVNRIVTRDRAAISSKKLEEIIVVRSLCSD